MVVCGGLHTEYRLLQALSGLERVGRVLPVKLRKSKLWGMERISVFYGGNAAMVVS
jgi:hypothetical protein